MLLMVPALLADTFGWVAAMGEKIGTPVAVLNMVVCLVGSFAAAVLTYRWLRTRLTRNPS